MNDRSIDDLIFLSKSWNNHPLIVRSDNNEVRYDKSQKSYIEDQTANRSNRYRVRAGKTTPVQNLSLVYSDWKYGDPEIKINGKKMSPQLFRSGLVDNGDKQSLVVWIQYTATQEFTLEVTGN
jgi:lipopolysaccharide export system protein LptA